MGQEGCHGRKVRFSVEYKCEAGPTLDVPGVTVNQIAGELGIVATVFRPGGGGYASSRRRRFGGMADRGMKPWPY